MVVVIVAEEAVDGERLPLMMPLTVPDAQADPDTVPLTGADAEPGTKKAMPLVPFASV